MAQGSEKRAEDMTVAELRERASELEITGRSSMNKTDLLQSVKDAEEQTTRIEADDSNEWVPREERSQGADDSSGTGDASDMAAPSIGPNTTIEHIPPEERLNLDEISSHDAMGLDKRRSVVGKRYGASPLKQALVYGGALAVIVAAAFGFKLLTDELDQPPEVQEDTAPWADAEQQAPAPIDFPRSTEK
jgi:hypothetical protein